MKKQQRPPPLSPSKFYRDDMFRVVHNVVLGAEDVEGEVMFVGSVGGTSRSGGSSVSAPRPRPQPRPQPMNDRRPPRMNSIRGNIWKRNKVVATEPPPSGAAEATAVIDISDGDDDDQDLTIIRDDTRKKKRMMRNSNSLKPMRRNNVKKKVLVVKKEKVYEKPFVSFVDFMAQGSFELGPQFEDNLVNYVTLYSLKHDHNYIQPESTVNPSNATTTTTTTTAQYYDDPFGSKSSSSLSSSSTVNNYFKNNFNSLGELGGSNMFLNQAQQLPIGQYRQDSVGGGSLEPGGGGGFFHGEQQPLMDSDGWRLTSLQNVKFNSYQNGFQSDSSNYRCLPISTENRELFAPLRQCFDSLAILEDGVDGGQSSGELNAYRAELASREELKRQHWQMYQSSGGENVIKQEELVELKASQEFKGRGLEMNKIGTPRQSPRRSKVITPTKPKMSTPVMVRPMQGQVNSYRNMSLEQVRLLHAFKVKCALESNDLRSPSSGKVITVLKSSKVQGQVVSEYNKMVKSTEELLSIRQCKSVEARDLQPLMSEVQTPRRSSRKVNAVSISSTQGQVVATESTEKVVPQESRDLGPSSLYTESPRRSSRKVIMTERAKCAGLTLAKVTRGQDRSYN